MRSLVAIEHMSIDGYVDSRQGTGFEWTHRGFSPEVGAYGDDHIRADVDTAVYGRRTFIGMRDYWKTAADEPDASDHDRQHSAWVNNVDKLVVSTTLTEPDWAHTTLIRTAVAEHVRERKSAPGGTMAIYASPTLVHSLLSDDLIDELRVMVHPVAVGGGVPLLPRGWQGELDLLESHVFGSGVIYLRYAIGR